MFESPRLSVITPSYNHGSFLEQAILSVRDQGYTNVEHIIIDGGSTDGSVDVIRKYEKYLAYWVSEPDRGMYDAINKGIDKASGDLIGILNSDDRYEPGALQAAVNIRTNDPEADVVWGSADMIEITSRGAQVKALLFPPKDEKEIIPYLLLEIPIFNGCFFRKQVFERHGLLMAQLKIAGDREFMLRAALSGCKFHTTDILFYHYYAHDNSMTYGNDSGNDSAIFEKWNKEHCQIAEFYLARQNMTENARDAYCQLHTNSNLSLIKIACKRGDFVRAFGFVQEGWRANPKWIAVFLKRGLKILRDLSQGVNWDD